MRGKIFQKSNFTIHFYSRPSVQKILQKEYVMKIYSVTNLELTFFDNLYASTRFKDNC